MPRRRRDRTAPETGTVLSIGPDIVIPIPDVPEAEAGPGDAESVAVAAAFDRLVAEGRLRKTPGPGLSEEEAFEGLEMPPGWAPPPASPAARGRERGQLHIRVPVSLRQELAARARAEGVSLNALVLAYLAHGLSSSWGPPPASKD